MRIDKVATVLRREYMTRIKSKGFWVATLILPLAMAVLLIVPSLLMMKTRATHRLTVVDATGDVGQRLATRLGERESPPKRVAEVESGEIEGGELERTTQGKTVQFDVTVVAANPDTDAQAGELDAAVLAGSIDAWIRITPETLLSREVEYRAASVSNVLTQERLERALTRVFSSVQLEEQGYDAAKVVELTQPVDLETLKVTEQGTRAEKGLAGFILAYGLFFMLYMVVAIYGGLVMNGVLEEKSSRIVEILLATSTPGELLLGKLTGIGLAGLTQLGVWAVAIAALTAPGVAGLVAAGLAENLPQVAPIVLVHFLLFFLLGFFLFSSMYAAIGAATNSAQEAQPLTGIVVPFLIAPMFFLMPVINDPSSTLAVVLSLIPTFTPLLMMLRVAVKMPPLWQILLSYLLTIGFVGFMVWVSARIYRIGILMYGKRPTFRELGRWILRT